MARLSMECRMRVVTLPSRGYSVLQIQQRLQEENISVCRQAIYSVVAKFENYVTHVCRLAKKSNQLLAFPLDLGNTRYDSTSIKWHTCVNTVPNYKKLTEPEHVLPTCLISSSAILNRLLNMRHDSLGS